jgi:hypothetical protein
MSVNWHSSSLEETKYQYKLCVISSFRSEVDEYCALLGYYAASSGKFLTDVSGQFIGPIFQAVENPREVCPETAVRNLPLLAG